MINFLSRNKLAVMIVLFCVACVFIYKFIGEELTTWLSAIGASFYGFLHLVGIIKPKLREAYLDALAMNPFFKERAFIVFTNWTGMFCIAYLYSIGWDNAALASVICLVASKADTMAAGLPHQLAIVR